MELFNADCFDILPEIKDESVNLFLLDLPYNQTACKWDKDIIDLEKMWTEIKRIMKPDGIIVMFCTARYGYKLIHSNPKWFRYDLIWKKSKKVGFLRANKAPLRQHENIYVFKEEEGTYNPQKTEGKPYYKNGEGIKTDFSKAYYDTTTEYKSLPNDGFRHPTSVIDHDNIYIFKDKEGTYNPQKTEGTPYITGADKNPDNVYGVTKEKGTEVRTDRHPTSVIEHENIYIFKDKQGTYNPQKTKGKPYTTKGVGEIDQYNGNTENGKRQRIPTVNTGDRHPSSIIENKILGENYYRNENQKPLFRVKENKHERHPTSVIEKELENTVLEFKNPYKTIHRTQKPVELCEWLIKTYSNEGDVVCDFCMGSGTVGVACNNTKRQFIGIEKDDKIFELAYNRIHNITSS